MNNPKLTLNDIKQAANVGAGVRVHRVSDYLTPAEMEQLHAVHLRRIKRRFDAVDALEAEIVARFGWDTYVAWDSGQLNDRQLYRWINAERAREARKIAEMESTILMSATAQISKNPRKNTGFVQKYINQNVKVGKGEN